MPAHDEIVRLYGPWLRRTPEDAVRLLRGYGGRWWIAGGWAVEAATGRHRTYGDLDIGIPRSEVALLQAHLAGRLDVWAAEQGALRPLTMPVGQPLPPTCGNLWLRRSGADPWEYDVLLTDVADATWSFSGDARVTRPLDGVLRSVGGVPYLRPEVQLLQKAPGLREKDQADFDACLPVLTDDDRGWLARALATALPGHPWIAALDPPASANPNVARTRL